MIVPVIKVGIVNMTVREFRMLVPVEWGLQGGSPAIRHRANVAFDS